MKSQDVQNIFLSLVRLGIGHHSEAVFQNADWQAIEALADRQGLLAIVLDPAIPNEKPKELFHRIVWKVKRWKANEWKHELCYEESMWSAFWSGVWGHLLKPSSI